jgi:hypothetical protein
VVRHQSGRGIDGDGVNLFGRVVRHILDVHAAFGRGDHRDAAAVAVDQQRQVELLVDVDAVGDVQPVAPACPHRRSDVTSVLPSISSAAARTSSIERASRTPPLASARVP